MLIMVVILVSGAKLVSCVPIAMETPRRRYNGGSISLWEFVVNRKNKKKNKKP